jgi:hypothetical protein
MSPGRYWYAVVVVVHCDIAGYDESQDWGFDQVVAITIWILPVLTYLYREVEDQVGDGDGTRGYRR